MESLTGQEMVAASDWAKWWDDNKKGFKCVDLNVAAAVQAEPDWPNLTEYADRGYGFTLKKPEGGGKFWKFAGPAEKDKERGQRAKIQFHDDKGLYWANCNVWFMKKVANIGNLEQFAEYFEKSWKEGVEGKPADFSDLSQPPKHEMRKLGGRDFMVITAKGMATAGFKQWDSCERRIYVFMPNPNSFVYFEAIVRNGAEDELKNALWTTLEGVTFTK
jgi:hypothetical protein